jgi:hypothetical protein
MKKIFIHNLPRTSWSFRGHDPIAQQSGSCPRKRPNWGLFIIFLLASHLFAAEWLPLQTELKVSGPQVSYQVPYGLRYRPGYLFPLKIRISNPGEALNAEILIVSDGVGGGFRSGVFEPRLLEQKSETIFTLPVRAPGVAANLSLVIRTVVSGSEVRPECFRAKLAQLKHEPDLRVILVCGRNVNFGELGEQNHVAQVSAAELPDEAWRYESVDLVVLSDDSFRSATPKAKAALRQWVLGGGCVFIAQGLDGAIAAGLLPLPGDIKGPVPPARSWWERNAGLRQDQILLEENYRPLYGCLDLGWGKSVFIFPTREERAREYGAEIFPKILKLLPARESRLDLRVQRERFAPFAAEALNPESTGRALLWIGLGAAMFCVVLILSYSSRSRVEALGLPLSLVALLAVMLARFFPEPQLLVSRITWARRAADGRATAWDEWALAEAFRRPTRFSAAGPAGGTLLPLYEDLEELPGSSGDCFESAGRMRLENLEAAPGEPLLLQGTALRPEVSQTKDFEPPLRQKAAILADASGALQFIPAPQKAPLDYSAAQPAIRATLGGNEQAVKARAAALAWAIAAAQRARRETLITWGEVSENELPPLVKVEGACEPAMRFVIYSEER